MCKLWARLRRPPCWGLGPGEPTLRPQSCSGFTDVSSSFRGSWCLPGPRFPFCSVPSSCSGHTGVPGFSAPGGPRTLPFFRIRVLRAWPRLGGGEAMRGLRAPQAPLVPSLVWECHASLPKVPGQGGRLARPSCGETGLRRGRQEMGLLTSRPLPSDGPHFSSQVCIYSDLRSTAQTCPAAFSLFIAVLANVCEVRHLIRLQVDQSVALVTFRKPCAATTLFPEFSTLLNRNQWLLSGHSASPPILETRPRPL